MNPIKTKALEQAIEESIHDVLHNYRLSEDRFTIEKGRFYEVQVVVTKNVDDFIGEVLPEYEKAKAEHTSDKKEPEDGAEELASMLDASDLQDLVNQKIQHNQEAV